MPGYRHRTHQYHSSTGYTFALLLFPFQIVSVTSMYELPHVTCMFYLPCLTSLCLLDLILPEACLYCLLNWDYCVLNHFLNRIKEIAFWTLYFCLIPSSIACGFSFNKSLQYNLVMLVMRFDYSGDLYFVAISFVDVFVVIAFQLQINKWLWGTYLPSWFLERSRFFSCEHFHLLVAGSVAM